MKEAVIDRKDSKKADCLQAYMFKWKAGARIPEKLAEPLGRLVVNGVSEEEVLDIATPEDNELHSLIPARLWNDTQAARECRLAYIRGAFRSLEYKIVLVPSTEADRFRGGPIESEVVRSPVVIAPDQGDGLKIVKRGFPVCVHVGDEDGKVYIPMHEAAKNPDQKREMIEEARRFLAGFARRFEILKNVRVLQPVFSAIDKLERRLKNN